jgi:hypothetical protein
MTLADATNADVAHAEHTTVHNAHCKQIPTVSEVMHCVMVFSHDSWHPEQLAGGPGPHWTPFHHVLSR